MSTRPAVVPMRISFSSLSSSRNGFPTARQLIESDSLFDHSFWNFNLNLFSNEFIYVVYEAPGQDGHCCDTFQAFYQSLH